MYAFYAILEHLTQLLEKCVKNATLDITHRVKDNKVVLNANLIHFPPLIEQVVYLIARPVNNRIGPHRMNANYVPLEHLVKMQDLRNVLNVLMELFLMQVKHVVLHAILVQYHQ
jgi:hypothetical protein